MMLDLNQIVFEYRVPSIKRIFNNLSAKFNSKELNFLVGVNGVGKSTLINLIAGTNSYSHDGVLSYNDTILNNLNSRERAKYILKIDQDVQTLLVPHFSIWEHLVLASISNKKVSFYRNAKRKNNIEEIVAKLKSLGLDLEKDLDKRIYQLNGGMQQTVAIAMLAIRSPNIALLDEPTANLDKDNGKLCFEVLKLISKESDTIFVIVSHDLELVSKYADKIFIMNNGVVTETLVREKNNFESKDIAIKMGLISK